MKYGADESNELHRSSGEIETESSEQRCKISPPEEIHDLRHDQDGKDHQDHPVGEPINIAVRLEVVANSTMGRVERPGHEDRPEQAPYGPGQGIRLRREMEQHECQKRESTGGQTRFEQKIQSQSIARVP